VGVASIFCKRMKSRLFLLPLLLQQLLAQASVTLDENEEFCERFAASVSTVGNSRKCRGEIFKYIVSQELAKGYHPVLDCACVGEEILKWHKECLNTNIGKISLKKHEIPVNNDFPSFTSVDYLFLIEVNCKIDVLAANDVFATIRLLLNQTNDGQVYHNVFNQVGIIIYSTIDKLQFLYASDFSSAFQLDVTSYFKDGVLDRSCATSETSVESGIRVLSRMTSLVDKEKQFKHRIKLANNKTVVLWHRPYSDLHVVSILSPGDNHSAAGISEGSHSSKLKQCINNMVDKIPLLVHSAVSLHMAFDVGNTAAKSSVGDPSLSHRYSDCSHFKKAVTLKALISADMGGSLQALLVSKGVEFQVHALEDFKSVTCVLHMSPLLSAISGLSPLLSDRCLLQSRELDARDDHYCSPLHGWTRKSNKKSDGIKFDDIVPLPVNYGSDHGDLASAAKKSSLPLQGKVQLSINQRSASAQGEARRAGLNIVGEPRILEWKSDKPFVKKMLSERIPTVLRGTVVTKWEALKTWSMEYLSKHMDTDVLQSVKCTNDYLTFDPDPSSPLKLNVSLPYVTRNMSTSEFFSCISSTRPCPDDFLGHYYFGTLPDGLKENVKPGNLLYHTKKDLEADKQFVWISSAGMITHTHFDQDYNFFVQLVGEKRFTLWSPEQHELMYSYPRVHPLWHKSRVNFRDVDLLKFPGVARARGIQVRLGPGDMLYVPPYTWHYVETLTPSVSLSTWSHDYDLYDHMNAIYKHDHKFDLLHSKRGEHDSAILKRGEFCFNSNLREDNFSNTVVILKGELVLVVYSPAFNVLPVTVIIFRCSPGQMFVLRLYLDMMVHDLYGFNETTQFFARLIHDRFSGLERHFPPSEDDPAICASSEPRKIPTCVHVHGYAKLDMDMVAGHFRALETTVRDILFRDYVEEITAQGVGVKKMLAFFRYCFQGQRYYVTEINSEEHALWDHSDTLPSDE